MNSLLPTLYLSAEERNKVEVDRLYKKCLDCGINIDEKDVLNFDCSCFASKFIHNLIIKDGYNKKFIDDEAWNNSNVFYRKYMSNPNTLLYVEMSDIVPDFETAANLIKKCGGLVFVPHIFEYRENSEKILDFILNNHEIDGIECYYTTFSDEQNQKLLELCRDYNLFISGGSDYHGAAKPNVHMGTGTGSLKVPIDVAKQWLI